MTGCRVSSSDALHRPIGDSNMAKYWKSYFIALLVTLFAVFSPTAANADTDGGHWEKLGERSVDGKGKTADVDTIRVGRKEGLYSAIRIKVEKSDIVMLDVKVFFDNGQMWSP